MVKAMMKKLLKQDPKKLWEMCKRGNHDACRAYKMKITARMSLDYSVLKKHAKKKY